MKRMSLIILSLLLLLLAASGADYVPCDYVWTTQSRNSSESMPCGGHDVGMNVWVEQGDLLFYVAQSGWFDENNTLLKAGRWRLSLEGRPFDGPDFEQRLCLDDGAVYVSGGGVALCLWADVRQPVVYVTVDSRQPRRATLSYESWRYQDRAVTKAECQQCSYKWLLPKDCVTRADSIAVTDTGGSGQGARLTFVHRNRATTVFDYTVAYEHIASVASQLYNPLGNRLMGGTMAAGGFSYAGQSRSTYASTDCQSWNFVQERLKHATICIALTRESESVETSQQPSARSTRSLLGGARESRRRSAAWWHGYWQRSWIQTDGTRSTVSQAVRNYELFRYMLGCNAYGLWPTKFNGGLFTFDPVYVDSAATFTPDYRKWGGGTMTAQNQRLVYWPMLKSGDTDMMDAQIGTYQRLLPTALAWTRHHWGHGGACFTEQLENYGLPNPAEYGKHPEGTDYGTERNAWLEYEWDTALEFCLMALTYRPVVSEASLLLAESCLGFFDEHYQYLARQRGSKPLDGDGRLVLYPGSGCETYKMAYNPASTLAALRAVLSKYASLLEGTDSTSQARRTASAAMLGRLPAIPLSTMPQGDTCIAPAMAWARIQNVETPQLYPVFPWRLYGLGRDGLLTARNTYLKDPHAVAMRGSKGWKQDNIWAACLGLADEAARLTLAKLADGPYRFPAFWDAGFDWAPDMNRGGSAMIGLQEMLLQEQPDGTPLLLPAWPDGWPVAFRLHTYAGEAVEASANMSKK